MLCDWGLYSGYMCIDIFMVLLFLDKHNFIPLNCKSIVDDFTREPGVVSMRVVVVLRSAEI